MDEAHVTVIGAGVIGVATAACLRRAGLPVTLLDASGVAQGCSFGNAGGISPGAIVPAATPGLLSAIPRWLLDRRGPLALRWRHLPRALPWMLRWVAQGTPARRRHNAAALAALNRDPYSGYRALLGAHHYAELIRVGGQLLVWRDAAPVDALARELRSQAGIELQALDQAALRALEPHLSPDYQHGVLFPGNGHTVDPQRLVRTIADAYVDAGGDLLQRRVLDFQQGPRGPVALLTDAGPVPVKRLVIAAGAWSARLARQLGVSLPMEAERGYHATFHGMDGGLTHPVLDAERRIMATPMAFGLRVAGMVEFAGLDAPPDASRPALLAEQLRQMLPALPPGPFSSWMGMRPSMPDSLPVIDRHPDFPTVYFACGHGHLGLSGAPTTARLLTDLITGRPACIDPAPYRLSRFHP